MNDVITLTNTASTVVLSFSAADETCTVSSNGKVKVLSLGKAETYMEALTEAGYRQA
jgi:hypothetical protein